jgi:hypothetical protein
MNTYANSSNTLNTNNYFHHNSNTNSSNNDNDSNNNSSLINTSNTNTASIFGTEKEKEKEREYSISSNSISNNSESSSSTGKKRPSYQKDKKFIMLEQEEILIINDTVILLHRNNIFEIDLLLTSYKLIFNPKNAEFFQNEFVIPDYLQVPYTLIVSILKKKDLNTKNKFYLIFNIRDRPPITIGFNSKKEYQLYFDTLNELISPKSINKFFAFKYHQKYEKMEEPFENGWGAYNHLLEYIRMGVELEDEKCKYRLYIQEINGEICNSYPNFIYIHKNISDKDVEKLAKFRSKKRFPALIWFSKANNSSMWRSSQAKTGVIDKRSCHDELFFEHLSKETEKFHIYDARPYINALANKMKGFGFENTHNYKNAQIFFCDIENIHKVKQSFIKMLLISQLPL